MAPLLEHPRRLDEHVHTWVDHGLVSPAQAEAILRYEEEATVAAPAVRMPLVAELFVYLGLILSVMGGAFVVTRFWDDLPWPGRLAVGVAVAVIGLVAGRALGRIREPAFDRLAGVADLGGTGGVALTAGVLAVLLGSDDPGVTTLVVGPAVLAAGLLLWRNRDRPLQFLSAVLGAVLTVVGLVDVTGIEWPYWIGGLAIIAIGALVVLAGVREWVRPPLWVILVGGVGAVAGAYMLTDITELVGFLAALAVSAGLVAVGLGTKRVPVTAVSVLSFLLALQATLSMYVRGTLAALGLLVGGLVVVAVAVGRVLSRGGRRTPVG